MASLYPRRARCFLQSNCSPGALFARWKVKRRRVVTGYGRRSIRRYYVTPLRNGSPPPPPPSSFDRVSSRARTHTRASSFHRNYPIFATTDDALSRWLLCWRLQHALRPPRVLRDGSSHYRDAAMKIFGETISTIADNNRQLIHDVEKKDRSYPEKIFKYWFNIINIILNQHDLAAKEKSERNKKFVSL